MKKAILSIFFFLCFTICEVGLGQEDDLQIQSPLPAEKLEVSQNNVENLELVVLKEQNKIIKDYHDSLLSTVYWSLGIVFTLAILLGGFSWFTNFKFYEKDKSQLRAEFDSQADELETKVTAKLSLNQSETLNQLDQKLESALTKFTDNIASVKKDISDDSKSISNKIEIQSKSLERIEKNNYIMETELRQVEEYVWDMRGIPGNILITQGEGLRAAGKAEDLSRVKSILGRIKKTIQQKYIDTDEKLSKNVLKILEKYLTEAQELDTIGVSELKDLLSKVPTKTP